MCSDMHARPQVEDYYCMALLLLHERFYRPNSGAKGHWDPYINILPDHFSTPHVRTQYAYELCFKKKQE
jgi:hypothetical protein